MRESTTLPLCNATLGHSRMAGEGVWQQSPAAGGALIAYKHSGTLYLRLVLTHLSQVLMLLDFSAPPLPHPFPSP